MFRPVAGELIGLMKLALDGTLDAHGREGVPRIRASTDVANAPMARAFARAGYVTSERRLDMTWR